VRSTDIGPFGLFRYLYTTDTWWWSDPVYEIHGFVPGEVVPTTELILAHKYPGDAAITGETMRSVLATGDSFALWHRVIDAQRRTRQVLSVGSGVTDEQGRLLETRGFMVDVTEAQRRSTALEIDGAVRASAESRADIEQAKGALMLTYALDAGSAFEVLKRYSQLTNVKVRDVARLLTAAVSETGDLPADARQHFDDLLADLGGGVDSVTSSHDDQTTNA
jgi:alkylated DNA nucleotide flippase Atl1